MSEYMTVAFEASHLCNEHPIGLKPNRKTDAEYLSPNHLLLGRSSPRIAGGPFQEERLHDPNEVSFSSRFLHVERIVDHFLENWMRLCFPSLIIRHKWHTKR